MNVLNKKGFTLIEVIVSITLLGLIAIFILPMFMYGVKYTKWNTIKLNALNLAYTQIEWLKSYDYEKLGLNIPQYNLHGEIERDKYLNEEYKVIIDGVEYKVFTDIYWVDNVSNTGELVLDASKALDVVVIARDVYSGKEKEYSVLRTLVTREGEKNPPKSGLMVYTFFRDSNTVADRVRLELNTGQVGQTNMDGKGVFVGLDASTYTVKPISWRNNDIIGQPMDVDNRRSPKWIFEKTATVEKWTSGKGEEFSYPELSFYIDFPGYIVLAENNYPDSEIIIKPSRESYNPPEDRPDHLVLKTNIKQIKDLKFWRLWKYEYNIESNGERYFLIDSETDTSWDGIFKIDNLEEPTYEKLELGFALVENGQFKLEGGKLKEINIEFTSKVKDFHDLKFTLDHQIVDKNYRIDQNGRKLKITFKPNLDILIDKEEISFEIINGDILTNNYNMKLARDLNKSTLIQEK